MKTFRIYLVISYLLIVTDLWFRLTDWLDNDLNGIGIIMTFGILYWVAATTCGYLLIRGINKASTEEKAISRKNAFNRGVKATFDEIYKSYPAIMRKDVELYNDEHKKIGSSTVWGQISDVKAKLLK